MKSMIYTAMTNPVNVSAGGLIPFGTAIHGCGSGIAVNGSSVALTGRGYYDVNISATIAPDAAGTASVALYADGVAVPGAIGYVTTPAANENAVIAFPAEIRLNCCANRASLTLVSSADATVSNVAAVIRRDA